MLLNVQGLCFDKSKRPILHVIENMKHQREQQLRNLYMCHLILYNPKNIYKQKPI